MFCGPAYPEARAVELIALWRDFMARAPAALSSLAEFSTIPDDPTYPEAARGQRVISLAAVYDGPADEGEALVAPLRAFGTPLADFSDVMPYRTIQSLYDAIFPKGRDRCYWKSLYLRTLDDNVDRRNRRASGQSAIGHDLRLHLGVRLRRAARAGGQQQPSATAGRLHA